MACFNINIGGEMFNISSPYTEFTGDTFAQTLAYAAEQDPELAQQLLSAINRLESRNKPRKLKVQDNPNIPYIIQANLESLGVQMEVHQTQESWNDFCAKNKIKNPKAKAFLHNGVIHVKRGEFKVSDAMHEFSHLILAYLKATDIEKYQTFLNTMSTNPIVKELIDSYKGTAHSYMDIQEEAVVSYIEMWFDEDANIEVDKQTVTFNGYPYDGVQFMGFYLQSAIKDLFGLKISNLPIMSFFSSLLMDVGAEDNKQFGCSLFTGKVLPNTGYSINKNQVVRAQQTKAVLDYFVDKEYLIKTEC